jgi:hypothetical protein
MRGRRLLVVIAASAALILSVSPAHAYSGPIYHGSDSAWVYWVDDDHITVCDRESDGHGVWVDYYTSGGGLRTMLDGNGSAAGCAHSRDWYPPQWITSYRLCERYVSCTGWYRPDGPGGI